MRTILFLLFFSSLFAKAPELFLLQTYQNDHNVSGWLMREKLDGVRAFWDGTKLISRSGKTFTAPLWFTRNFPAFALDGELYIGRGSFERTVSMVNTTASHEGWREVAYHVFEVPHTTGGLLDRLAHAKPYEGVYLKIIPQLACPSHEKLMAFARSITDAGGEGAVVRRGDTPYQTGRLASAVKVKFYEDAECTVTGTTQGEGKYRGMAGAILCDYEGQTIKIGTGLSDHDRAYPPLIGARVTFKYYGRTAKGTPKFATFIRQRSEE